ncbi:GNAT family N-acetyltransferase [Pseudomonas sp. efr-133-TYG-5]|jgi:GNAT superfamily N-acetyltransferase|uniref:GNAT family N-acetyltransferase n=1 Tax=Pseudomonas sp. efr-133-TYG-5 TaxID=3040310 RepID=UPI00255446F1|nr:GNAT family N-acetyltransferase [Pseudomonas sp. efr-133-TYG-5]
MTIVVRRAREADAPHLPAIEQSAAQLFRLDPQLAWLADSAVPDAAQHAQAIREATVWVAEVAQQQLAGFLRAVPVDNQLHIEELSVSQHWQGRGIGRKLLLAAIEQARHAQLQAITLTTFRDLPWNAPFYQRLGFSLLTTQQTDAYLRAVLDNETRHGLPRARRCAMRLALA